MPDILPGVLSIIQYKNDIEGNFKEELRPEGCEHCHKSRPWRHGCYPRKAAGGKNNTDSELNPINIQRYYCASCHKTMSVLPECIPPSRWYLWTVQSVILLLITNELSIYKVAKGSSPSRHSISRWLSRFKESFLVTGLLVAPFNLGDKNE
jgi:transposase-like protein